MDEIKISKLFELSEERHITGRRKFRAVLHEIYPDNTQWNENGISWSEQYTKDNIDSVEDASICVEFLDNDKTLPYGHGLTEIRDNMPLLENATVVGHFKRGFVADIEIDGVTKKVLVGEGYIDEMRYPKFVAWLKDALENGTVKGSVEIVGHEEHENRIVYEDGWKKEGRVPMVYDYSGYAILGIRPADESAVILELNDKTNEEETNMTEEVKNELASLVSSAVAEQNSKWDEYWAQVQAKEAEIAQLRASIADKEAEIEHLRADLQTQEAEAAAKEAGLVEANAKVDELNATIAEQNSKIEEMEKVQKVNELNAALAKYSEEEQALAADEIAAFKADPNSVELNSIISKICVALVEKNKEAVTAEQNAAAPDIFSAVSDPAVDADPDIF